MYSHTRIEVCVLTQIVANLKLDYFHYFHLCFVGPPQAKDNFMMIMATMRMTTLMTTTTTMKTGDIPPPT